MKVCVSSAGRIFNRLSAVSSGGRFSGRTGESEQVSSEPDTAGLRQRVARFEGRNSLIDAEFRAGARRISVSFDAAFASCTARVVNGRQSGAGPTLMRSMVSHQMIEVLSVTTGPVNCEVKEGNVFAQ
jgi:hypothetical protein